MLPEQRKLKERIDETMSKSETDALARFWNDELVRESVRKVLLFVLYNSGTFIKNEKVSPLRNLAFFNLSLKKSMGKKITNEEIGEELRILHEALQRLEDAFNSISVYGKIEEELEKKPNPAT